MPAKIRYQDFLDGPAEEIPDGSRIIVQAEGDDQLIILLKPGGRLHIYGDEPLHLLPQASNAVDIIMEKRKENDHDHRDRSI